MKNLLCYLFAIVFGVTASAQKVYFVYFETDNSQPFYLKIDDKVYTSSLTGSFVLPNLTDSTYDLSIGIPSTTTEAKFKLAMNGKDHGYAIKNFDFGLGLFDLQSLSVTRPQVDHWKSNVSYQYRNNEFTNLLARASNDTSLYYVPVVMKEEVVVQNPEIKKEETAAHTDTAKSETNALLVAGAGAAVQAEEQVSVDKTVPPVVFPVATVAIDSLVHTEQKILATDSLAVATGSVASTTADSLNKEANRDSGLVAPLTGTAVLIQTDSLQQQASTEGHMKSKVKRQSESTTSEGFSLVFHDNNKDGTDTIAIIIPNPAIIFNKGDTVQFEDGLLEIRRDTMTPVPPATVTKSAIPKSKCTAVASDNDFLKLRKNMLAKHNEEDMILEAKKIFRGKCFSTGQVKELSSLFLNDEGKYQFFDAVYTRVTDQEVFYALQGELKDEYYVKRFKALIGD